MDYQSIIGEINKNLYRSTERLAAWLLRAFKKNSNYWCDFVLTKLSDNQRMITTSKGLNELIDLDLAALLRIADRNWYELLRMYSDIGNTEREIVRAITGIRNRWAHCSAEPYPKEQILSDLYNLRDFFKIIGIDANSKTEIRNLIRSVIDGDSSTNNETVASESLKTVTTQLKKSLTIELNSIVRLKSDSNKTGVVLSLTPIGDTIKYQVFIDGKNCQFFADQIELVQLTGESQKASLDDLLRIMTARQLCPPSSNNLFSLNAAKIDFVPYQFRPALKIIKSETPRLLIADGVGVGKTIEAGLIIKELAARSPLETIIIICPRPLVAEKKWEREMRDKFGEDFQAADKGLLRQLIKDYERDGKWDDRYSRLIIPYSILTDELLNGAKGKNAYSGLESLDPPPLFDMLIVDEAHHIRNSNTERYKVVKYFTEHSNSVLFLTATPIQLGNNDLYTLLNLLFPEIIIDKAVFNAMAEPNEYVNAAIKLLRAGHGHEFEAREAIEAVVRTEWGARVVSQNPDYKKLLVALSNGELSREARVKLIGVAEGLHSFANAINRTRRQDIDDFCVRRAVTHKSVFAPKQQELHDELLNFVAAVMSQMYPSMSLRFLMCTIRRQAASCIFGLTPFIEDIITRNFNRLGEEPEEFEDSEEELDFKTLDFGKIGALAAKIIELAKTLPPDDPKFDTLEQILRERDKLSNGKTIIFSTFRHTLRYLKQRIKKNLGLRVELVDGSVKDEERYSLRERFALSKENPLAIDILLFSEVGSEGLDYQFCDAMVNYDLPWNPMRIEQRIGRIDRRGQKSETVQVFNCITHGTIDYEIYERCYKRIGIFEKSLGECSEILGGMEESLKGIIFDTRLTEKERADKMEKMADNSVFRMEEDRKLENESKDMFGLDLNSFSDDIEKADSQWLSQTAIKRMINGYLSEKLGQNKVYLSDNGLSLTIDEKGTLFEDYNLLDGKVIDKNWEKFLKSSKPNCSITLSASEATKNRKNIFLTLLHPLVRQAANYYSKNSNLRTALNIIGQDIPQGKYPFSLYAWEYKGYRPRTEFVLVCEDEKIKDELLNALPYMTITDEVMESFDEALAKQEAMHLRLWRNERECFLAEVKARCNYKIVSLEKNVVARRLQAEQQLFETDSTRIEIMRRGQIERIEEDFKVKKARHEKDLDSADLVATLLASGVIIVQKGNVDDDIR